jgi:hypothetical protein
MTTRIAGAILVFLFATATAAAHAQATLLVPETSADLTEQPTSMPDYCAQLDINCVLNDGPPHWVPFSESGRTIPGTTIPGPGAAPGTSAGAAAIGGAVGATTGGGPLGVVGGH